jgi:abequosyltransferase
MVLVIVGYLMEFSDGKMEATQTLLTIAIPTYNRSEFLDLCLRRLAEELESLQKNARSSIIVYISNNASTDDTDELIEKYRARISVQLIAVTNSENIGADRNIAQCYKAATTPYVWILGDDDVILPGRLGKVLDVLASRDLDVLYLNGYSYSEDYRLEPKRGRGKSGVVEFSNSLDFVKHTHIMLTFITAIVVRSGVNLESVTAITAGSHLLQLGWVLQLVRDGKKFAVINDRVFAAKIANSGGYGAIDVFGRSQNFIVSSILESRPELANAIQNGTIVIWFPTYIMNVRRGNTLPSKNVYLDESLGSEIRQVFRANWRYHLFLWPLIKLPMSLARLYFLLVRIIQHFAGASFI